MTWCSSRQKHQTPAFRQENGTKLPVSARNLPEVGGNGQFGVAEGLAWPLLQPAGPSAAPPICRRQGYLRPPSSAGGRAIRGLPPSAVGRAICGAFSSQPTNTPFRQTQSGPAPWREPARWGCEAWAVLRRGTWCRSGSPHWRGGAPCCKLKYSPRRGVGTDAGWLEAYAASCCCWP